MADDTDDPLAGIAALRNAPSQAAQADDDPLSEISAIRTQGQAEEPTSTEGGAFLHAAERGAAPAIGGLLGAAAGGAAAGSLVEPGAGTLVGGLLGFGGALAGFWGGAAATEGVQNYALSKAPDTWKDALGQSDRQLQLDEQMHPTASFLGGLAPYALTMTPFGMTKKILPEGATAFERLMANPATQRLFGGTVMGGMELGQEAYRGQYDWRNVAISTGFGVIFNRPSKFGELIERAGAAPFRPRIVPPARNTADASITYEPGRALAEEQSYFGVNDQEEAFPGLYEATTQENAVEEPQISGELRGVNLTPRLATPTLAEVDADGIFGMGNNEATFIGTQERADGPMIEASNRRSDEIVALGQTPQPDIELAARRLDPEAFDQYDALTARRAALQKQIDEFNNPPQSAIDDLDRRRGALEQELTELVDAQHGHASGAAVRKLRAQIRDVQAQNADLFARQLAWQNGQAVETPETAAFRQQLIQTDQQLRDLDVYPRMRAAREKAALSQGVRPVPAAEPAPVTRGATLLPAEGGAPAAPAPAEAKPPEPVKTPEQEQKDIAAEVEPQLAAIGVEPAQAKLAAQYQAMLFAARSRWFGGKRGSAAQLLKEEGPIYTNRRNVSRETAQPLPPKGPLPSRQQIFAAADEAKRKQGVVDTVAQLDPAIQDRALAPRQRAPVRPSGAPPQTIREWLTTTANARGKRGIDPNSQGAADLAQVLGVKAKNGQGPFRTGGMPVDYLREAAAEQGFLGADTRAAMETSTINDLLGAIEHNQVSQRDLGLADEWRRHGDSVEWWKEARETEAAVGHWLIEHEPGLNTPRLKLIASRLIGEGVFTSYRDAVEGAQELLAREARGLTTPREPLLAVGEEAPREAPLPSEDPFAGLEQEFFQKLRGQVKAGSFKPGANPLINLTQFSNASTLIHEYGHQMLELLLGDADHPLAPDQLKADAATIRRELGMRPDQGTPTTEQHEQFAHWFEQYLMEGVAPTRGLERVFREFKKLLLKVYDSARKIAEELGLPINDNVRQVFDRYLSAGAPDVIVRPPHERGPTLVDIHRAEASYTHPDEAEAVGDRVVAERDKETASLPLETVNEHENAFARATQAYAESQGQAVPGAGGPAEVDKGGGGPAAVAAGAAGGAERGAVVKGGGNAVPEGANAGAAGPERAGAGRGGPNAGQAAGAQQFAARNAQSFAGGRRGNWVGNVRIDKITNVGDFAHWIEDAIKNNDFFRQFRGPMTNNEATLLAKALGFNSAADINQQAVAHLLGGFDDLAPRAVAAAEGVNMSAQAVHEAWENLDPRDPRTVAAVAEAIARHDLMTGALSKVRYQLGRGLAALKISVAEASDPKIVDQKLKEATGKTYYQLVRLAKMGEMMNTPGKVSKFLRDAQERSFGKMLIEYWVNGLISGFATHATYTVGNEILTVNDALLETPTAALIGTIRNALGRVERIPPREGELKGLEEPPKIPGLNPRMYLGEAGAKLRGHISGLPAAIQAMLEGARTGQTTLLPGEVSRPLTPFEGDTTLRIARRTTNAPVTWHEVAGDLYGMFQGAKDAIKATAALVQAGGVEGAPLWGWGYSPLGQIPDFEIKGITALPLGTMARVPSRMVAAIHSFFKTLDYTMHNNASAYRQAVDEGLTGIERNARVAQLRQDPSERSMELNRSKATELTMMGQGGPVIQYMSKLSNTEFNLPLFGKTPVLKFIDPFVHIAGNIIQQALIERTPAGILSKKIREDLSGVNGNIAQDLASAKMLVGSVIGVVFGSLAAKGVISGSGPQDPAKAAVWRLAGNQPHSVKIGDVWYDAHRLGPMGMLLGVSADMYDVAHMASEGQLSDAASALAHGVAQNVLDESFMRGPADLLDAIHDPHGNVADSYVSKFFSSMVPYSTLMRQMDRSTDPYVRRARSIMDGIKQTVPGLSESLFPKRDIWGEALPNGEALIHSGVTAIYERRVSRDPVNIAMLQLGMGVAPVEQTIRNVKLSEQQYDDYARIAGRMTKLRLDAIVGSPDFSTWPANVRQDAVKEVVSQCRETARGIILMQYPQLMTAVRNANLKKHGFEATAQ